MGCRDPEDTEFEEDVNEEEEEDLVEEDEREENDDGGDENRLDIITDEIGELHAGEEDGDYEDYGDDYEEEDAVRIIIWHGYISFRARNTLLICFVYMYQLKVENVMRFLEDPSLENYHSIPGGLSEYVYDLEVCFSVLINSQDFDTNIFLVSGHSPS